MKEVITNYTERRIIASFVPNERVLLAIHPADGTGCAFEKEVEKMEPGALWLESWAIMDRDDENDYSRYLLYLHDWVVNHVEMFEGKESPMSYEAWKAPDEAL